MSSEDIIVARPEQEERLDNSTLEADGGDSDLELEAAVQAVEDDGDEDEAMPDGPAYAQPQHAQASSSSTRSAVNMMPPPRQSIPQDLSLIAEMVSSHQVVGSFPPLSVSAAEKRRLVMESMRAKAEGSSSKGKGKEVEREVVEVAGAHGSDTDSDSSSEFLSDDEGASALGTKPMTEQEHATIKQEIDRLVGAQAEAESSDDSDSSSEEEDEAEDGDDDEDDGMTGQAGAAAEFEFSNSPAPSPRKRFVEIPDDDDEGGGTGPILSAHEAPLPPVAQPPIRKLPDGEEKSLAGDVVSWMRDRKLEAWLEKEKEKAAAAAAATAAPPTSEPASVAEETAASEHPSDAASTTEPTNAEEVAAAEGPVAASTNGTKQPVRVDSWTPSQQASLSTSSSAAAEQPAPIASSSTPHRFTSAGTLVIRAMQARPGFEDWLEEGSVICWEDGRVVGTVAETFGPLTSPFYSVRLPPPPHPYPSLSDLSTGTKLYYPVSGQYRTFVDMHAVRDPRFKGTDASNLYDEEVGADEMEWSDDEAEAEAKRQRKLARQRSNSVVSHTSTASRGRGGRRGGGHGGAPLTGTALGLPSRPHSDYQPEDDMSEVGSSYGGGGAAYDDVLSETGSSISARGRPMPEPYDLEDISVGGESSGAAGSAGGLGRQSSGRGRGGGREHGGRGRGQGRDRGSGRGRGGGSGGRGGGRGQGDRRVDNQSSYHGGTGAGGGGPQPQMLPALHFGQGGPMQSGGYQPHQPCIPNTGGGGGFPTQGFQPYVPYQPYSPQQPHHQAYNPHMPGPYASVAQPMQQQQPHQQGGGVPAINPLFAAQYAQQFPSGGYNPGAPSWPNGQQSQGGYGGGNQYSE